MELAAGPALRRARKLLRKVGQEPRLLDPEMEEALDGELAVHNQHHRAQLCCSVVLLASLGLKAIPLNLGPCR